MHVVFIASINRKMELSDPDPIEIYRKCSNLKKIVFNFFFHWSVWIFYFFLIPWTFGSTYPFFLWVFNMIIWRLIEDFRYFLHFGISLSSICLFLSNFAVSVISGYLIVSLNFSYLAIFKLLVLSFCTLTKISLCKCYAHQYPIIYYLTTAQHSC